MQRGRTRSTSTATPSTQHPARRRPAVLWWGTRGVRQLFPSACTTCTGWSSSGPTARGVGAPAAVWSPFAEGGPKASSLRDARMDRGRAAREEPGVGFRCCSGAKAQADVNITHTKEPPLVEEPSVDAALSSRLLEALPKDLRTLATATASFD